MSASITKLSPRASNRPSVAGGEVVRFPSPLGGPVVQGLLNQALQSCFDAYRGEAADLGVLDDLSCAVADPLWDDVDAPEILEHVEIAARWLSEAEESTRVIALALDIEWWSLASSHELRRAAALSWGRSRLEGIAAVLRGRIGDVEPVLSHSDKARGLMDIGFDEIE
jgi:hypothetical protein